MRSVGKSFVFTLEKIGFWPKSSECPKKSFEFSFVDIKWTAVEGALIRSKEPESGEQTLDLVNTPYLWFFTILGVNRALSHCIQEHTGNASPYIVGSWLSLSLCCHFSISGKSLCVSNTLCPPRQSADRSPAARGLNSASSRKTLHLRQIFDFLFWGNKCRIHFFVHYTKCLKQNKLDYCDNVQTQCATKPSLASCGARLPTSALEDAPSSEMKWTGSTRTRYFKDLCLFARRTLPAPHLQIESELLLLLQLKMATNLARTLHHASRRCFNVSSAKYWETSSRPFSISAFKCGTAKDRRAQKMVNECKERGISVLRDPKFNKVSVSFGVSLLGQDPTPFWAPVNAANWPDLHDIFLFTCDFNTRSGHSIYTEGETGHGNSRPLAPSCFHDGRASKAHPCERSSLGKWPGQIHLLGGTAGAVLPCFLNTSQHKGLMFCTCPKIDLSVSATCLSFPFAGQKRKVILQGCVGKCGRVGTHYLHTDRGKSLSKVWFHLQETKVSIPAPIRQMEFLSLFLEFSCVCCCVHHKSAFSVDLCISQNRNLLQGFVHHDQRHWARVRHTMQLARAWSEGVQTVLHTQDNKTRCIDCCPMRGRAVLLSTMKTFVAGHSCDWRRKNPGFRWLGCVRNGNTERQAGAVHSHGRHPSTSVPPNSTGCWHRQWSWFDFGADEPAFPVPAFWPRRLNRTHFIHWRGEHCCEQDLLHDDETYIGLKHKRVRGKKYDDFIEEFLVAVNQRWVMHELAVRQ